MELETVKHKWCWGELLSVILDWFRNVVLLITGWCWWRWGMEGDDIKVIGITVRSNKIIT